MPNSPPRFPAANPFANPPSFFSMPEWAGLESQYPSGPPSQRWWGTAVAISPAGDIFIPNTKPPAQEFNWLFQQLSEAAQAALFWGGVGLANTWQPPFLASGLSIAAGGNTPGVASNLYWEPVSGFWLLATQRHSAGTEGRVHMLDPQGGTPFAGGTNAQQIGSDISPSPVYADLASDPAGNIYVAMGITGGTVLNYVQASNPTHAWINVNSFTTSTDIKITWFNGTIATAYQDGTGNGVLGNNTPTGGGATGVSFSTSTSLGIAVSRWILKATGVFAAAPHVLAIPNVARTPQVWQNSTLSATAGGTWTTVSVTGAWGNTDVPIDLAWGQDNSGPCWLLAVQRGGAPAVVDFYRSTNGVVWTLNSTVHQPVISLAAVGGCWVAMTYTSSSGRTSVIFSLDAVNWYQAPVYMQGIPGVGIVTGTAPPPKLSASGNQFAMATQSLLAADTRIGSAFGIPGAPLT